MTVGSDPDPNRERLKRLVGFADIDPSNLALLADAVETAIACGEPAVAGAMLERYTAQAPLTNSLLNLRGQAEIQARRFAEAAATFTQLLDLTDQDPAIRFNLAWCLAMQGDFARCEALLDDAVIDTAPRAASLLIEALHHQNRIDEALERGADLAKRKPGNTLLMGALAASALDIGRRDLAQLYAAQAGDDPDGLSTQGMLDLEDDNVQDALPRFAQALAIDPANPRALLGKGLVLIGQGDHPGAAQALDLAAQRFGTHLGSWVAAGWAYFVQGDYVTSRSRFERALAVDDTFAETHGGLAVLDIVAGDLDGGQRRTEIALRLDRRCFSAALAQSLLLAAKGDEAGAERVKAAAMNFPTGPNGRTLAQALVAIGTRANGERP